MKQVEMIGKQHYRRRQKMLYTHSGEGRDREREEPEQLNLVGGQGVGVKDTNVNLEHRAEEIGFNCWDSRQPMKVAKGGKMTCYHPILAACAV